MIFLGITGSFFGAVYYDKWQTSKNRQKWCDLVAHKSEEALNPHSLPRRLTIYLAAPPGDGLRAAREHFHEYVKPVLVAASMDWDVVEGRKEGDVRFKTADRVRRRRKAGGEGEPLDEADLAAEVQRQKFGLDDPTGVAGDIVIGRHTWKEYVRGLHEGWLGPTDAPKEPETEEQSNLGAEKLEATHIPGQSSVGDAAANAATDLASASTTPSDELQPDSPQPQDDNNKPTEESPKEDTTEEKKEEPEKPKPRHPPPFIAPEAYPSASLSALIPSTIGPSTPVSFPHLLGFRNTPIRIYRFLNRRFLADDIGRQVASAVLASHRPYSTTSTASFDDESSASSAHEVSTTSQPEERNWWKTTFREREPHEESVWIEPCVVDERVTSRMSRFELSADEEARAARIGEGKEGVSSKFGKEEE